MQSASHLEKEIHDTLSVSSKYSRCTCIQSHIFECAHLNDYLSSCLSVLLKVSAMNKYFNLDIKTYGSNLIMALK